MSVAEVRVAGGGDSRGEGSCGEGSRGLLVIVLFFF